MDQAVLQGRVVQNQLVAQGKNVNVTLSYVNDNDGLLTVSVYDHDRCVWRSVSNTIIHNEDMKLLKLCDLREWINYPEMDCPICGSDLINGRCPNPAKH